MIRETLQSIDQIDRRIQLLSQRHYSSHEKQTGNDNKILEMKTQRQKLLEECSHLTPEDRVFIARHLDRPHVDDYIKAMFTDFFEQKGDHLYNEDLSIFGGIARFHGIPVTVIGHRKGHNVKDNLAFNFGMPRPEGYRKALRLMEQAEKFRRPIITFIDTPGAYPGKEAEEHGQGEAIAKNLAAMSSLTVPVISVIAGEGNSGGALALSVSNRYLMLENSVYSVLSPEGFASILWKDASKHGMACEVMKLTAQDLLEAKVADTVVPEPVGGAQLDPDLLYKTLDPILMATLEELMAMTPEQIRRDRHDKFRQIGSVEEIRKEQVS